MSLAAILGPIIARTAADVIAKKVGSQKAVPPAVADDIAKAVIAKMETDPAMKNETNSESLWQSRVVNGTVVAFVTSCGVVYTKWKAKEFDEIFFASLASVLGTGYAFLGRVLNWSQPMWSRLSQMMGRG
jgi:hypothetical protein